MTNLINEILQLIITANKKKSLQYDPAPQKLWNKFPYRNGHQASTPNKMAIFLCSFSGSNGFDKVSFMPDSNAC